MKRRRVKRNNQATQSSVNRRMRELWADGLGLLPYYAKEADVDKIRKALRCLVMDGAYWNGLIRLRQLKKMTHDLSEDLKKEGFQLPE